MSNISDLSVRKAVIGEKRVPKKLNSDHITIDNKQVNVYEAAGKKYGGGVIAGVFDFTIPENFFSLVGNDVPKVNRKETRKWLLILCNEDFFIPDPTLKGKDEYSLVSKLNYRTKSEQFVDYNTSVSDGHKNTYGDGVSLSVPKYRIFKKFQEFKSKGHRDWYIPSFYEMLFMGLNKYSLRVESAVQRELVSRYGRRAASDMRFKNLKGNYISSSTADINNFKEINGTVYNYGVQFNRTAAGSYYPTLCNHRKFHRVRPVRRIYLP